MGKARVCVVWFGKKFFFRGGMFYVSLYGKVLLLSLVARVLGPPLKIAQLDEREKEEFL